MTDMHADLLRPAMAELDWAAPPVLLFQGLNRDADLLAVDREVARRCEADGHLLVSGDVKLLQPFAGLQQLVEALYARAAACGRRDLAEPHWIAIRTVAPSLADQVPARRPDACQAYRPGDTRRRAAPQWVQRCLHSLVDFLFAVQAAMGDRPLAVGFPELDVANRRVREFFNLLARRSCGKPVLLWATAPGRFPDDLLAELQQRGQPVRILNCTVESDLHPSRRPPAVRGLPGAAACGAAELVAVVDSYCYNGLWGEVLEYGQMAFERLDPADMHLLPVLADAYRVAVGDSRLAQQHLRQQLPHAQDHKQRINLLNYLVLLFGQWEIDVEAGEYYAKQALAVADSGLTAAERAELRVIAIHGLVLVWSRMGKLEAANAAGRAAIDALERLCPWDVERVRRSMVLFLMAQNCERLGRLEWAIELYRASLRYDEDYPEYYHYLCGALVRAGRCEEALAVAAEGMERNPPYWLLHMWRGQALAAIGRDGDGEAEFARALELNPGADQVYLSRALYCHERGQLRQAITDYTSYLELAPDDMEALSNRGSARHDAGDHAGALADFDLALGRQPNLISALANRAAVLADLGRAPEALADLERALALAPDNPILHENRAALQAQSTQTS